MTHIRVFLDGNILCELDSFCIPFIGDIWGECVVEDREWQEDMKQVDLFVRRR